MAGRGRSRRTRTYAQSGVDRGRVGTALRALLAQVHPLVPPEHGVRVDLPGHYAGLVRIGRETIAITTDTVGTKVVLAERLGRWEEVGEDMVAVNVNDLAAVGARPAGFVDTIVCARPDAERFRAIGRGLHDGLTKSACALLGGETAVQREIVHGIDLGGTAIGFFPNGRPPVTGARIRPGDRLIGIPSSGPHANGYTLIRRIVEEAKIDLRRPRPGGRGPVGRELLAPTRIYSELADDLAGDRGVHGYAHLSGGGLRNLVRLHPKVRFTFDGWPAVPPLFDWLGATGGIAEEEMFQTFNMGIGFVIVAGAARASAIVRRLASIGAKDAVEIGRIEAGHGVVVPDRGLRYSGYA